MSLFPLLSATAAVAARFCYAYIPVGLIFGALFWLSFKAVSRWGKRTERWERPPRKGTEDPDEGEEDEDDSDSDPDSDYDYNDYLGKRVAALERRARLKDLKFHLSEIRKIRLEMGDAFGREGAGGGAPGDDVILDEAAAAAPPTKKPRGSPVPRPRRRGKRRSDGSRSRSRSHSPKAEAGKNSPAGAAAGGGHQPANAPGPAAAGPGPGPVSFSLQLEARGPDGSVIRNDLKLPEQLSKWFGGKPLFVPLTAPFTVPLTAPFAVPLAAPRAQAPASDAGANAAGAAASAPGAGGSMHVCPPDLSCSCPRRPAPFHEPRKNPK